MRSGEEIAAGSHEEPTAADFERGYSRLFLETSYKPMKAAISIFCGNSAASLKSKSPGLPAFQLHVG